MATLILFASQAFADNSDTLRTLAEKKGLFIGGAIRLSEETLNDPQYFETFKNEFNVIVPEHVMKFDVTHSSEKTYDFSGGDFIVDFANHNSMKVRGHTLVWHDAVPEWVNKYKFSRRKLKAILHDHILNEVTHFKSKLLCWDVVNEAIGEDGQISRQGIWPRIDKGEHLGDYVRSAFNWAHQADPNVLLFYNDYGTEELNKKSDGVYNFLKKLKEEGVPVHGVGFQVHISYDEPLNEKSIRENFKRFSDLGLIIHITEMDVRIPKIVSRTLPILEKQGEQYRKIFGACLVTPLCQAFLTWGITDKYTWITEVSDMTAPLLLDELYAPKPAYKMVRSLLDH
jgi:endo-1,4-beta-xylanase